MHELRSPLLCKLGSEMFSYFQKTVLLSTLILCTLPTHANVSGGFRERMLGYWQCESVVVSPFGTYTVVADAVLEDSGKLQSDGSLVLEHSNVPGGIPMNFNSTGSWSYFNTWVTASDVNGTITTPYPLLNSFAESLKSHVLSQPMTKVRLSKIGSRTMVLVAEDQTEIRCLRYAEEAKG
jgi:hypothetical protein